jgi:chromosome segregation ATPase
MSGVYKGMSVAGLLQTRPIDMSSTLFRPEGSLGSQISRNYGAGAIEASNARILEEAAARRQAQTNTRRPTGTEGRFRQEIKATNEELTDMRRRRQVLEAKLTELKAKEGRLEQKKAGLIARLKNVSSLSRNPTEKERKREAAFARKREEMGAKPAGVRKVVAAAAPAKFHGFRMSKREDQ